MLAGITANSAEGVDVHLQFFMPEVGTGREEKNYIKVRNRQSHYQPNKTQDYKNDNVHLYKVEY